MCELKKLRSLALGYLNKRLTAVLLSGLLLTQCTGVGSMSGSGGASDGDSSSDTRRRASSSVTRAQTQPVVLTDPNSHSPFTRTSPVLPPDVRSVRLLPLNSSRTLPFIELGSSQRLQLRFDHFSISGRGFTAEIQHLNPDGSPSGLAAPFFLDGFNTLFLSPGVVRLEEDPSFTEYELTIPREGDRFLVSGFYQIDIRESGSGRRIMTVPFFVTENKGELQTLTERLYVTRQAPLDVARLRGSYHYPDWMTHPQSDLRIYAVADGFWSHPTRVENLRFDQPGHLNFDTRDQDGWVIPPPFRLLDLRTVRQGDADISLVDRTATPMSVELLDIDPDFPPLHTNRGRGISEAPPSRWGSDLGSPAPQDRRNGGVSGGLNGRVNGGFSPDGRADGLDPAYVNVTFRFELPDGLPTYATPALSGDFTGWQSPNALPLYFDSSTGRLTGTAMMRRGVYAYRFGSLEGGIFSPYVPSSFTSKGTQEVVVFVVYYDASQFIHRILSVQIARM